MRFLELFKREFLSPVLDFIYPPICFGCGGYLSALERLVCDRCWQGLEMVYSGDETFKEFARSVSAEGIISRLVSPFYFEKDGKLQSVIHALKYQGYSSLGVKAGRLVGRLITTDPEVSSSDFLIPVPLHPLKKRERGYNQSDFICRGIQEITGIPIRRDILHRWKYTVSQTQLSSTERIENVGDAFGVDKKKDEEITGKVFILVDDLITTRSTMNACAKELQKAGARRVYAATLALAK